MPSGHRPQPPVGTARVAISGTGKAGNQWVNVFWLNLTATTHVVADLKSIIDTLVGYYNTDLQPSMSSDFHQLGAKATWLYASGNAIEYAGSYNNVGGDGNSVSSDAMCSVIDWTINDYYRGGHPRTYFPGLAATHVNLGRTLVGTYASTLAAGANAFISHVNAETHGGISAVALGTVRFASGNAWLSPPVFRAYQSASVRSIVGTQRRRYAAY
jgi:hypothetical protein